MKNKSTLFLVQAALIGAIYVVLTLVFAPFSYGEVQVRISEALTMVVVVGCMLWWRRTGEDREIGKTAEG